MNSTCPERVRQVFGRCRTDDRKVNWKWPRSARFATRSSCKTLAPQNVHARKRSGLHDLNPMPAHAVPLQRNLRATRRDLANRSGMVSARLPALTAPVFVCDNRTAMLHVDAPRPGVYGAVMPPAEQHSVVDVGAPAVLPGGDMVSFTADGRNATARNHTLMTVAGNHRLALRCGEHPLCAAQRDQLRREGQIGRVEHHRRQPAER